MKKTILIILIIFIFILIDDNYPCNSLSNKYENFQDNISISDRWVMGEDDLHIWRTPWEYRAVILTVSCQFDIPYKYLYRLIYIESKFNENATRYENNGSVSIGCMQLNTNSLEFFSKMFNDGKEINPFNKEQSIYIGAAYLKYLYKMFDNDWLCAFTAYNWGPGNFKRGRKIPDMTIDYAFSIYYGPLYAEYVKEIKGAVANII